MESRRRRGSYAKSAQTRATILDAALEVFAESGYRSGSLREIAQRVGMTDAGLLHHFDSKARLLAAVLDRRDELALQIVNRRPEDGISVLQGIVELAAFNASEPGVVELHCTLSAEATSPDHPAHQYFVVRYERIRETLRAAFADLDERGLLRAGITPSDAARTTVAVMDGLQVQWLLDRSQPEMAADLRRFLSTLIAAEL
jgi:AcrR family transcriptional regulator